MMRLDGNLDSAVQVSIASQTPNTVAFRYRAWFLLQRKEYAAALKDLKAIQARELRRGPLYQDMATAYAGLGDWESALHFTL